MIYKYETSFGNIYFNVLENDNPNKTIGVYDKTKDVITINLCRIKELDLSLKRVLLHEIAHYFQVKAIDKFSIHSEEFAVIVEEYYFEIGDLFKLIVKDLLGGDEDATEL